MLTMDIDGGTSSWVSMALRGYVIRQHLSLFFQTRVKKENSFEYKKFKRVTLGAEKGI